VRWDLVCAQLIASRQCEAIEAGDSTTLRSLSRAYSELQVASMTSGLMLQRLRSRTKDPVTQRSELSV